MNKKKQRIVLIAAVLFTLVFNAALWIYRSNNKTENDFLGFESPQVDRLKSWNELKRVEITDDMIEHLVEDALKKQSLEIPPNVSRKEFDSLAEECKLDFRDAVVSLIKAYRDNKAESAFMYHTKNRGGILDKSVREQLLVAHRKVNNNPQSISDLELLDFFWNIENNGGFHWKSLLAESGDCAIWSANFPLTQEQVSFLNSRDKEIFHGQSVFPNVFTNETVASPLENGKQVVFGDFFFVTELDDVRNSDFLPLSARFFYNEKSKKWFPLSLSIVVPSKKYTFALFF